MKTYELAGVPVQFPYDAYEPQLVYMQTVIEALKDGKNALLESPTGTGKTLCLLCAALAWRSLLVAQQQLQATTASTDYELYLGNQRPAAATSVSKGLADRLQDRVQATKFARPPLIIYASRTHSQLSQVVSELRKTAYRPRLAVVGSREQLCTNKAVRELKSNAAITAVCGQLVRKSACGQHSRVGEAANRLEFLRKSGDAASLMDIEDLVNLGNSQRACPFYLAKNDLADAELVMMPYNYLVDRKTQSTIASLDLTNAVVIFDEAHNIENTCGEASSTDICGADLTKCLNEISSCGRLLESGQYVGTLNESALMETQGHIIRIKSALDRLEMGQDSRLLQRGEYIVEFFATAGINESNVAYLVSNLEEIARFYLEGEFTLKSKNVNSSIQSLASALKTIFKCADLGGDGDKENVQASIITQDHDRKFFRVFAETTRELSRPPPGKPSVLPERTISYWCFNPGIALRELMNRGIHSMLLTSGTLSPLTSFTAELQLPFPYQLENSHIVTPKQVFCSVVRTGPTGIGLNSSFQQRDSELYKRELGKAIFEVAKLIPDGLLVFFPSYSVMDGCLEFWRRKTSPSGGASIYNQIASIKVPVVEPKAKGELKATMGAYYRHIAEGKKGGAVFFAVCRGKVSEGLDFADSKGRGVIITGIPYPPLKDARVILKRQYLDDLSRSAPISTRKDYLSGDEWYSQQASRAVNQAIGRVIRHRHDYGAILLFDDRFASHKTIDQLSKWLRPHVHADDDFSDMRLRLTRFFSNHREAERARETMAKSSEAKAPPAPSPYNTAYQVHETIKEARDFFDCSLHVDAVEATSQYPRPLPAEQKDRRAVFQTLRKAFPSLVAEPKSELRLQAKGFLDKIKLSLSEEAARGFNSTLKKYRAQQVTIDELIEQVLGLFHANEAAHLTSEFRDFISKKHHGLFDGIARKRAPDDTVPSVSDIPSCDLAQRPSVPPTTSDMSLSATKTPSCPLCKDPVNNGYKAKCGHACCFACWSNWLQVKLECPLCRMRTRIPQLRKAFM